jgi:hypothetical protein
MAEPKSRALPRPVCQKYQLEGSILNRRAEHVRAAEDQEPIRTRFQINRWKASPSNTSHEDASHPKTGKERSVRPLEGIWA